MINNCKQVSCNKFIAFCSCSVTCCRKHRENKCEVLVQRTTDDLKDDEELVVKRRKLEAMQSYVPDDKMEQLSE